MAEKEKAAAEEEEYGSDGDGSPLPALRRRAAASDEDEDSGGGGGEEEYVSDLDGSPLPVLRRRAAASDDDEDSGGGGEEEYASDLDGSPLPALSRRAAASDDDDEDSSGGEEEYTSDADDSPLPAFRRRAEASDDDEDDGGGRGSPPRSTVASSDSDSEGQGAAEAYGDEDEDSEKCQGVQEDFGAGRAGGGDAKEVADEGKNEEEAQAKGGAAVDGEDKEQKGIKPYAAPRRIPPFFMHDDRFHNKENDGHGRQRQREFFGGPKSFHPKDDSVWVHDRFDEMNIHHVQHDDTRRPTIPLRAWAGGRTHGINHGHLEGTKSPSYYHGDRDRADYKYIPKNSLTRYESSNSYTRFPNEAHNTRRLAVPFRAWAGGRTHGVNNGYLEGTKSPSYYHGNRDRADYKYIPKNSLTRYESSNNYTTFPNEARTSYDNLKNCRSVPRKLHSYDDNKNFYNARREPRMYHVNAKGYAPNVYRGKPSRPYQPQWKNTFGISSVQSYRTYSGSQNEEACFGAVEGKRSYRTSNSDIPLKEELPIIQRIKERPAIFSKLFTTSVHMAHSSLKTQSRAVLGVKAFVPSGGHGNSVDSVSTVSIKGMPSLGSYSSVSTSNNYSQYSKSRDQGTGLNNGKLAKNKFSSTSQATRSHTEFSDAVCQQSSVQQVQPRQRAPTQIFHQNIASTNNIKSHPQARSTSSTKDAETTPPPGSKNSEAPSVVIGQNDKEESVRASFPHDGGHALGVTGARGLTLGDQGIHGTPAVLPAMQFSGQHPSVPDTASIGMALPGHSSHQLGGNSETNRMTWLPTLSGATGSFWETHHPCYLGSYYSQPSELPSASVSSRNYSMTDVPVSLSSHETPEVVDQVLHQRKNKPRRCRRKLKDELALLVHKAKKKQYSSLSESWGNPLLSFKKRLSKEERFDCLGKQQVLVVDRVGFWNSIVRSLAIKILKLAVTIRELFVMIKSSRFASALLLS